MEKNIDASFVDLVYAGYPLILVQTHEEERAISSLSNMLNSRAEAKSGAGWKYSSFAWDIIGGMSAPGTVGNEEKFAGDPLGAIEAMMDMPERSVLFVKDYHRFISSVDAYRRIKNSIRHLKSDGKVMVFVSPEFKIPIELEKDITVMTFALPTVGELTGMADKVVAGIEALAGKDVDTQAMISGRGLILEEAENAVCLSLVMKGGIDKTIIESAKLQAVKKSGLMEICTPVDEKELGGMKDLKEYVLNRKRGFDGTGKYPAPKGILLVGTPGTGKSLSAKVIASVLGYPLIKLDIASLKGSLVGESERKMRQATDLIDAISPCVVWMDEIEKALSGVQSSGRTDGGTTSAMFGHLLTWMQESETPKFMVATCNDIGELMELSQGALLRRFDDVFWIDTPTSAERKAILEIMIERYGLEGHPDIIADFDKNIVSKMNGWTGAEIEKFAKDCIYDGVAKAFKGIRPIAKQNKEIVDKAKAWAENNARRANTEKKVKSKNAGRKVNV